MCRYDWHFTNQRNNLHFYYPNRSQSFCYCSCTFCMHKHKKVNNFLFSLKNTYRKETRREITPEIAATTDAFASSITEIEAYRAGKIYKTIKTVTSNRRLEFSYCSLIEHVGIAKCQKEKKVLIFKFQVKKLENNFETCRRFDDGQIAR